MKFQRKRKKIRVKNEMTLYQKTCWSCGNPFIQNSANHVTCGWCNYYKKKGKKNPETKPGYPKEKP